MKEYIDRLVALTGRYLPPDPARLAIAPVNKGTTDARILVRDYVKDGDMMTVTFDAASKRATKVEVRTALDDAPVSIVLLLDQLHDGPTYPSRMVIKAEEKNIELRVLTYDYRL